MAGFVPGRDRVTVDALQPEETRRRRSIDSAGCQADLDKGELAELERAQAGLSVPARKRSLIDRILRRR